MGWHIVYCMYYSILFYEAATVQWSTSICNNIPHWSQLLYHHGFKTFLEITQTIISGLQHVFNNTYNHRIHRNCSIPKRSIKVINIYIWRLYSRSLFSFYGVNYSVYKQINMLNWLGQLAKIIININIRVVFTETTDNVVIK